MPKKKRNNNKKGKAARKAASVGQHQSKDPENEAARKEREMDALLAAVKPNQEALWQRWNNRPSKPKGEKTAEEKEAEREEVKMMAEEMLQCLGKDMEHMLKIGIIEKKMTKEEKVAAEVHDEALFKGHPTPDDCDICFLPLPLAANERTYKLCCGKVVCDGCIEAMRDMHRGKGDLCPFCREITLESNIVARVKKRMKLIDPNAFPVLADIVLHGKYGYARDEEKGFELLMKAGELGCAEAYYSVGNVYYVGGHFGVEKDVPKAKHFLELSAINGCIEARHDLGCRENTTSTVGRGLQHFHIGARAGFEPSMRAIKKGFKEKYVTKDEYEETLRAYQQSRDEMKSKQRDKALAFNAPTDDEALFKDPPPRAKCPLCLLPIPFGNGQTYNSCCGITVCGGCVLAKDLEVGIEGSCASCGAPPARSENEAIKRMKKRMELKDGEAFQLMGAFHKSGALMGVKQDHEKAVELWKRGGELGSAESLGNIADAYDNERGMARDMKKAKYYYEQSSIMGDFGSRHNLGCIEGDAGNIDRAVRHWTMAAMAGVEPSMKSIKRAFMKGKGYVTKDEFEMTMRAYHDSMNGMKSKQRAKAATLLARGLGPSMQV
mmetsp:Transcript_11351/g.24933  ORF Transcript_11351/g.24933 Transcript_11351/m.24933 type:complete len:606 (-) Transcript_11351:163-1980(-)